MKTLNFLRDSKKNLIKAILVSVIISGSSLNSYNNPLIPPPLLTEIHFGTDGWSLEFYGGDYFGSSNLDNFRVVGLYDTARFNPGIVVNPNATIILRQSDFMTPLYINPEGDHLKIQELYNDLWLEIDYFGLPFGEIPGGCEVGAPTGEGSVAWQKFYYVDQMYYEDYWTVKESPNTMGSSPLQVNKRSSFSGYVRDFNNDPLPFIKLDYTDNLHYNFFTPLVPEVYTNEEGYFFTENMFCKEYHINFSDINGIVADTEITIEPDMSNYFEFKLDTLLTGINEIKPMIPEFSIFNIPNPSSSQTKFIIETSNPKPGQNGVIKIYSETGYIVDILPVEINNEKEEVNYSFNDESLTPGIYVYNLEIKGQKVASGKMILTR
jgi:hypothetical protein